MGRKNFLLANTPGGTQGYATIFSLIETDKESNLNLFRYLVWFLSNAPIMADDDAGWAEKLTLPHKPVKVDTLAFLLRLTLTLQWLEAQPVWVNSRNDTLC